MTTAVISPRDLPSGSDTEAPKYTDDSDEFASVDTSSVGSTGTNSGCRGVPNYSAPETVPSAPDVLPKGGNPPRVLSSPVFNGLQPSATDRAECSWDQWRWLIVSRHRNGCPSTQETVQALLAVQTCHSGLERLAHRPNVALRSTAMKKLQVTK